MGSFPEFSIVFSFRTFRIFASYSSVKKYTINTQKQIFCHIHYSKVKDFFISQLIGKLRSEFRVCHDAQPQEQTGLKSLLRFDHLTF